MVKNKNSILSRITSSFGQSSAGKGFNKSISHVDIYDERTGQTYTASSADDLANFLATHGNYNDQVHKIYPRSTKFASVNNAWKRYHSVVRDVGISEHNMELGGDARKIFGASVSKSNTNFVKNKKLAELLEDNRSRAIGLAGSPERLVQIAKRKDPKHYYKFLDAHGFTEQTDVNTQAGHLQDLIRSRRITNAKSDSLDRWASQIVWEVSKDDPNFKTSKNVLGSNVYENFDKNLSKNYNQGFLTRAASTRIRKKINKKFSTDYSKTILNRLKTDHGFTNDGDLLNYANSPEGQQEIANITAADFEAGRIGKSTLKSARKLFPGTKINETEFNIKGPLKKTKQRVLIGNILGYTGESGGNSLGGKYLHEKLSQNPDAVAALEKGDETAVRNMLPSSVDYNDLMRYKGKKLTTQEAKHFEEHGIEVINKPQDLEEKLAGTYSYSKPTGGSRGRPSGSSGGGGRIPGRKGSYSTGGSLLGHEEIIYRGGKAEVVKKRGRISDWMHRQKSKIPVIRSKEEKQQKRQQKYTQKKRQGDKYYQQLKDDKTLDFLTDEERRYIAYDAGAIERKYMLDKARHMYRDKSYRDKILAKREAKEGIYTAKLLKAKKESKRRARAATSPFWKAWYTLTHNMMVLVGVALIVALLFLPIGLFHVLGWLIAAGIVSLVMFIVWVFIELWFLIAQALTSIINFIGQALVGIVNWIGQAFANALGQPFTPFSHTLVQNMNLVEIDPITGQRKILGITWAEWNLVPPDFLKLDAFMPTTFDTDVLIAKIWPAISGFFEWYTNPIANAYTNWISSAPWYTIAAVAGIPIVLVIIGAVVGYLYLRRKMY